jgi:hypothetical protein
MVHAQLSLCCFSWDDSTAPAVLRSAVGLAGRPVAANAITVHTLCEDGGLGRAIRKVPELRRAAIISCRYGYCIWMRHLQLCYNNNF